MKKAYLLLMCLLVALQICCAQRNSRRNVSFNKPGKQADNFLKKQWWLGFKAGPNLSKPVVDETYHVISPTNYEVAGIAKQYENFRSVGSQATFELTFYFRGFSVSFLPTYRTSRFVYSNEYEWMDAETPGNQLLLNYEQEQKVSYMDWPILAKYEFRAGKVIPYAQFGVYSSLLLDATKSVTVSGIDHASGGVNNFESEPIIIGAADLFAKYHWGMAGGVGIYYPLGNVRLNLDITYRHGMSNISSTQNRYGSDRLSGVGDSLDDLKLNNLALSVGCLFPLRFLGSGFKSMIDK